MRRLFTVLLPSLALSTAHCAGQASPPEGSAGTSTSPAPSMTATATTSVAHTRPVAASQTVAAVEPDDKRARIYSKRRHVWIQSAPSTRGPWIGYLGLGGHAILRDQPPIRGDGCASYYAIEPRGYVCLDTRTTLDPTDSEYAAIRRLAPLKPGPFPFEYGESRETPRYWSVPSRTEQRRREWRLDDHLANVARMKGGTVAVESVPPLLRGVDPSEAGIGPDEAFSRVPVVHEYRLNIKAGSTISWASSFDAEGRTWLVTADLALVPKDKVAPFPHSVFQGVAMNEAVRWPLAFARYRARPRYARSANGSFDVAAESLPRLGWVSLTGQQATAQGKTFLETREPGTWIEQSDATVVRPAAWTPWGEAVEGGDSKAPRVMHRPAPPTASRGTWIEVSVHGGWMIAYERTRPVFATLVAPGKGRTLRPGDEESVESATPPGVFNIQGKYLTSTMAVTDIVHFDVSFAMPFAGTIALHAGYWHDRWGEKASMGCVNLSPIDANWLFKWAEPELPAGWHGVSVNDASGYATIVVVHG